MKYSLIILALLAGCSTGVVQTNPNQFMVAKQSAGGIFVSGEQVKADLYKEANSFCESKGQAVETIRAESKNATPFLRNGKGAHEIWTNDKRNQTLSKNMPSRDMANVIMKQAGIKHRF